VSEDKAAEPKPTESTPPEPKAPEPKATPQDDRLDIADFARVELRAGRVKEAEKIADARKLLRLQVDLGTEVRQIVAGIAEDYAPEDLVGRTVAVVANLKPAKLRGVVSNGMLLAADVDGRAVLATFGEDVAPGTKIR
jgi:methionyl-tRNA synthetase